MQKFSDLIWQQPLGYEQRRELCKKYDKDESNRLQVKRTEESDYSLKNSINHKCIFVHIPKTAGVSINKALFHNLNGGHLKIREYQIIYSQQEFEQFFKFTIIRNPWDRALSAYNFLKIGGFDKTDQQWATNNLQKYKDFNDFIINWLTPQNSLTKIHFEPQYRFLRAQTDEPQVDFIGRYETLQESFTFIKNKLNMPEKSLKETNKTKLHNNMATISNYTPQSVERVAEVYQKDIELFNYQFKAQ